MIEFSKAFVTTDGKVFAALRDAQHDELLRVIKSSETATDLEGAIASRIIGSAEIVVDILTLKPSSKPKARSIRGGKKTRKMSETATPA